MPSHYPPLSAGSIFGEMHGVADFLFHHGYPVPITYVHCRCVQASVWQERKMRDAHVTICPLSLIILNTAVVTRTKAKNSVIYVSPYGIHILPNLISAGALPRTPLWELTTLPQTSYSQLGMGYPSPFTPHRCQRVYAFSIESAQSVNASLDLPPQLPKAGAAPEYELWSMD